jgi:hypothetical protein
MYFHFMDIFIFLLLHVLPCFYTSLCFINIFTVTFGWKDIADFPQFEDQKDNQKP